MNTVKFGLGGLLVGAFIGLMVGSGESRLQNTTEKQATGSLINWTWTIVFAIGGAVILGGIGASIDSENAKKKIEDVERALRMKQEQEAHQAYLESVNAEKKRIATIEATLGIGQYHTETLKEGRYWAGVTKWVDSRNGKEYILKTEKSKNGLVITVLNGKHIIDHDSNSANKDYIPSVHQATRMEIFKRLIAKYQIDSSITLEKMFELE